MHGRRGGRSRSRGHAPRDLERGDRVSCVCTDCGDRYTHIERVEQDPPRSTRRCPECHGIYKRVGTARVAGTWRINDDETRAELTAAIEAETPYLTYVEDRVGDVHVYDPADLPDDTAERFPDLLGETGGDA